MAGASASSSSSARDAHISLLDLQKGEHFLNLDYLFSSSLYMSLDANFRLKSPGRPAIAKGTVSENPDNDMGGDDDMPALEDATDEDLPPLLFDPYTSSPCTSRHCVICHPFKSKL
ncbi:hypothetical protein C8R47DRAFT_1226803 [Mycena vitilis]|nr:hypothetical protein C8R47DRAFT_1226803 [Mycena vitilis]